MASEAIDRDVRLDLGTSDDLDAVMEVMRDAFGDSYGEAWTRSQLAGILPMAGVSLTLARAGPAGSIRGFSLSRTVTDESELLLIAVLRHFHRSGIGALLLGHFLDSARKDAVARVHLEVRDGNGAIAMYRACGFKPVGRRRNYYSGADGARYDAVTLAREL
jgi:ribosomal-protein-alanine N-acetyltransferase